MIEMKGVGPVNYIASDEHGMVQLRAGTLDCVIHSRRVELMITSKTITGTSYSAVVGSDYPRP